jgi:hypothetical protein
MKLTARGGRLIGNWSFLSAAAAMDRRLGGHLVGRHPGLQETAHLAGAPRVAALQVEDQSHHGRRRGLRRRVGRCDPSTSPAGPACA